MHQVGKLSADGASAFQGQVDAIHGLGVASFWLHLVIVLVFLNFLPHGKHFHVLTALPNVFFRALPPGSAAPRKLDLESEDASFGTRTIADLSWKEAFDVYSCTECGRYICPKDMVETPVGYKCRECARPAAGQLRTSKYSGVVPCTDVVFRFIRPSRGPAVARTGEVLATSVPT